jgi:hypothetical protein
MVKTAREMQESRQALYEEYRKIKELPRSHPLADYLSRRGLLREAVDAHNFEVAERKKLQASKKAKGGTSN